MPARFAAARLSNWGEGGRCVLHGEHTRSQVWFALCHDVLGIHESRQDSPHFIHAFHLRVPGCEVSPINPSHHVFQFRITTVSSTSRSPQHHTMSPQHHTMCNSYYPSRPLLGFLPHATQKSCSTQRLPARQPVRRHNAWGVCGRDPSCLPAAHDSD